MMETEVRLINANEIVKVAERAYHEWCLAMVGADDTRKVNEVYKKQYLCKVVKAVAENCPTIDPESLRPVGKVVLKERHRGGFCKVRGLDEYGVEHTVMVDTRSYGKEPYCSECGAALADSFQDYCPRCGAKMEG